MPHLQIDGRSVIAQPGQTVLEAARGAGIVIPTLCYHPDLSPVGAFAHVASAPVPKCELRQIDLPRVRYDQLHSTPQDCLPNHRTEGFTWLNICHRTSCRTPTFR